MKSFFGWMKNSTKIKRWILLIIIGMVLACYGFAQILVLERLEINDIIKIVLTFVAGATAFIIGMVFMQKRTLELAVFQGSKDVKKLGNTDTKNKDPKVVVIGGGVGLNRILTGLKNYTNNLTAIVTVSTYGNNRTKPTDTIKQSIIALAQDSTEMEKLNAFPHPIWSVFRRSCCVETIGSGF